MGQGDGSMGKNTCHESVRSCDWILRIYLKAGWVQVSAAPVLLTGGAGRRQETPWKLASQLALNKQQKQQRPCLEQTRRQELTSRIVLWSPHVHTPTVVHTHLHSHTRKERNNFHVYEYTHTHLYTPLGQAWPYGCLSLLCSQLQIHSYTPVRPPIDINPGS